MRIMFRPIVQMFYPIPKSALIPIMMIWIGFGDASKIVIIFLGCMLPVTVSAFNGARGVDVFLIWSARSLGATRGEVLREVISPAALPAILAGIRTALALSFLLLVSSEFLISRNGLGYMISNLGDAGNLFVNVRGRIDGLCARLRGRPPLSHVHAAGPGMARVKAEAPTWSERMRQLLSLAMSSGSIIVLLVGWELLARSGMFSRFLLPPLSLVLERVGADAVSGLLLDDLTQTLYRTLVGFLISAALGIVLGVLIARTRFMYWLLDPIVSVGFPTPKIAFLPVFMLWFGVYNLSKVALIVFNAVFPVIIATVAGTQAVEKELLWSARSLGASERELLWEIVMPAALPQIMTGLQVAMPIVLVIALVTEMLMGGTGIGGTMIRSARLADSRRICRHRRDCGRRLDTDQGHGVASLSPSRLAFGSAVDVDGMTDRRQRLDLCGERSVQGESLKSIESRTTVHRRRED